MKEAGGKKGKAYGKSKKDGRGGARPEWGAEGRVNGIEKLKPKSKECAWAVNAHEEKRTRN